MRTIAATLTILALFLLIASPCSAWKFAAFGDSQGTDNGVATDKLADIVARVNAENVDLAICYGDAVDGSSNDATLGSQLDTWLGVMANLNCSWYYTVGNHEIKASTSEAVVRTKVAMPTNGPAGYEETVYSFDHNNAHFVAVNSVHWNERHHVQRSWLTNNLAATSQPHIFVMSHEPAYPTASNIGASLDVYPAERLDFWNILTTYNVSAYFCGHEHLFQRTQRNNVYQIISGSSGAFLNTGYANTVAAYHYVLVDINGNNVHCEAKDRNGRIMDRWDYTVTGSATPNVSNLICAPGNAQNVLTWTNPTDANFSGVMVRFKNNGYPTGPTDGTQIYNGTGTTTTHSSLTNGLSYFYRAFAYDTTPIYAPGVTASGVPSATSSTVSNSAFDADANGWTINLWRANTNYSYGTMGWTSGAGNPGGAVRCIGAGSSDNNDTCTREGGEMTRTISTSGYNNIRVSYDLRVSNLGNTPGTPAGSCTVDHNLIEEQLTIYYSTNGGTNWTEWEYLGRGALLGYTSYGTRTIDLREASGVNNNANFALKFRWQVNHTGDICDLDNIKVVGSRLDTTAPSSVTGFTATAGVCRNTLAWTNLTTADWAGTRIMFKTTGYPAGATDGTLWYSGTGTSTTHVGLAGGVTYYYRAYAFDAVPNYSSSASATATPIDEAPPGVVKGLAPKNVILVIGDGMGFEAVKAARIYYHGDAVGNVNPFNFEMFPYKNSVMTNNKDDGTTDSAAAGSAMATGRKYSNGDISWSDGDVTTALEVLKARGKRTGLITKDTFINDATPAAFGAHDSDRGNHEPIAHDLFYDSKPNILFGGVEDFDETYATTAGYAVVNDQNDWNAFLQVADQNYTSGQFGAGFWPSLAEQTGKALDILDNDPDGFFLLVENEGADNGGHDNDISKVITSIGELEDTINVILDWAQGRDDTLIIVTSDHETGGLFITETTPQQGEIPAAGWTTGGHTQTNTPIFANGAGASYIARSCPIDNTEIFHILTQVAGAIVTKTSVNGTNNDAEENVDAGEGGGVDITSADLELIYDGSGSKNQLVGMRFQSIPIPPGSLILNAYVQFQTDEASSGDTDLVVRGERIANSPRFESTAYNISNRTPTNASVAWDDVPEWDAVGEASVDQRTPDIKAVIQEIIDLQGWAAGNDLSIIISGSGARVATSYDLDPDGRYAPELVIEWLPTNRQFWGTLLGGSGGEIGHGVRVAPDGSIVVVGRVTSTDFPANVSDTTYNGGSLDGFVAKYSESGSMIWATYLGGSAADWIKDLAIDKLGNIYVCGYTYSSDLPTSGSEGSGFDTTASAGEGFIAKYTPNGTFAWASYIGGSGWEYAHGIAIDKDGNVWVTGNTSSYDFPVTGSEGSGFDTSLSGGVDAYVIKIIAATRSVGWGSYIGGSNSYPYGNGEYGEGIAVSPNGTVWATGSTSCTDFPIVGGFDNTYGGSSDAYVVQIDPTTRQIIWSSYLGATGRDDALGIAVDNDGNAWISGTTLSTDFPVYDGIERDGYDTTYDAFWETFAAKITAGGDLAWATYLYGEGSTGWNNTIAVDPYGNGYVVGISCYADSPTTGVEGAGFDTTLSAQWNGYVVKINSAGDMAWGTFIGGSTDEQASGIACDSQGRAVVVGYTCSSDFPLPNGEDTTLNGGSDVFVTVIGTSAETKVENRVASSTNDAEEEVADGAMDLTSTDLELIQDGTDQKVGIRFYNLGIPKNALITKAYIQFSQDEENMAGTCSLTIKGQAADNAGVFTSTAYDITNRPLTTAAALWTPPDWGTPSQVGPDQRSPDVRGIVQEIVNRANWSPNNGMVFIITGSGRRNAYSYNGSAGRAPLLHVEWIPKP